jgi:hypothetical protein
MKGTVKWQLVLSVAAQEKSSARNAAGRGKSMTVKAASRPALCATAREKPAVRAATAPAKNPDGFTGSVTAPEANLE